MTPYNCASHDLPACARLATFRTKLKKRTNHIQRKAYHILDGRGPVLSELLELAGGNNGVGTDFSSVCDHLARSQERRVQGLAGVECAVSNHEC